MMHLILPYMVTERKRNEAIRMMHKCNEKDPRFIKLSKEGIYNLYWKDNLTQQEIADKLKVARTTLQKWMKRHEVPTRNKSQAKILVDQRRLQ